MLEKDIQLHILKYLQGIGAMAGKSKTTGIYDAKRRCFRTDPYLFKGYPDLTIFWKKQLFFCEVKSGKNQQSEEQRTFQRYCMEAGIIYILAYSVDDVVSVIH